MNTVDFKNYRFRAHSGGNLATGMKVGLTAKQEKEYQRLLAKCEIGGLTTNQLGTLYEYGQKRDDKPGLSEGCKNWLKKLHWQELTGRRKIIQTQATEKGIAVEQDSINTYNLLTRRFRRKNERNFKNSFFTGTPDNLDAEIVRDFKSSFTLDTFPAHEKVIKNAIYYWQLQIYMDLTRRKKAELIYVLENTPAKILNDILRGLDWKYSLLDGNGFYKNEPEVIALVVETVTNHIFTYEALNDFCHTSSTVRREWFTDFVELPPAIRVKVFELDYDAQAVKKLKKQALEAREYLTDLSLETAERLTLTL